MTKKERERSYEYYKQWQENKIRYRNESIAYVLLFGVGLILVVKNMHKILLGAGIVLIIGTLYLLFKQARKWLEMQKALKDIKEKAIEMGAEDVVIDTTRNSISFVMSSDYVEEKLRELEKGAETRGMKMSIKQQSSGIEAQEKNDLNIEKDTGTELKSTEVGYINRNNQKNLGKTNKQGTDHNQYFYEMECLKCGHRYYANGTDIWQRKCPACQGGEM